MLRVCNLHDAFTAGEQSAYVDVEEGSSEEDRMLGPAPGSPRQVRATRGWVRGLQQGQSERLAAELRHGLGNATGSQTPQSWFKFRSFPLRSSKFSRRVSCYSLHKHVTALWTKHTVDIEHFTARCSTSTTPRWLCGCCMMLKLPPDRCHAMTKQHRLPRNSPSRWTGLLP